VAENSITNFSTNARVGFRPQTWKNRWHTTRVPDDRGVLSTLPFESLNSDSPMGHEPKRKRRRFDVVLFWVLDRFTREGLLEKLQYPNIRK
jgi:hypothetical protein